MGALAGIGLSPNDRGDRSFDSVLRRRPCQTRAIAVIDAGTDHSVGLSDEIERAAATIIRVNPSSVEDELYRFDPFPWAVAGVGDHVSPGLLTLLETRPILTFWLGEPAFGLPEHTRVARRWLELVAMVRESLTGTVAGMHLAPCRGVYLPDHSVVSCCDLEGFIGGRGYTWRLRAGAHRRAQRVLQRHSIPATFVRTAAGLTLSEVTE